MRRRHLVIAATLSTGQPLADQPHLRRRPDLAGSDPASTATEAPAQAVIPADTIQPKR